MERGKKCCHEKTSCLYVQSQHRNKVLRYFYSAVWMESIWWHHIMGVSSPPRAIPLGEGGEDISIIWQPMDPMAPFFFSWSLRVGTVSYLRDPFSVWRLIFRQCSMGKQVCKLTPPTRRGNTIPYIWKDVISICRPPRQYRTGLLLLEETLV